VHSREISIRCSGMEIGGEVWLLHDPYEVEMFKEEDDVYCYHVVLEVQCACS
jgi:hypothetical protein